MTAITSIANYYHLHDCLDTLQSIMKVGHLLQPIDW